MSVPPESTGRRRIRRLHPTLANQIAAGEVVERPASVLKELLENSLDAGATRIRVEVERGGVGLIRVRDDGAGIHAEDLALALCRHATSKIATLAELESVASMGFRGEALPSIASVARVRIESSAAGAEAAWSIVAEGGEPRQAPQPVAHPTGTTVSVRDLFFNTPARRKFLRTERTELRHLDAVFRRLALACYPAQLTLAHNARELLRLPAATTAEARRRRLARVLGASFADGAIEVERSAGGMRLWGWIGAPELARERSEWQHLYVNGRAVSDAMVRHAVRLAFGPLLPERAQPAWLLYLELPPEDVDVNVHPTKQEVRFREARMVHDLVRSTVRHALGGDGAPVAAASGVAPGVAEPSASHGGTPSATAAAPGAFAALAVLADDVLVARRGGTLVLARVESLRREHALRELGAAVAGEPPLTRPLLIPERVAIEAGSEAAWEAALPALARLGVELRRSGPGHLLLLAVPEALAEVPPAAVAGALARPPQEAGRAAAWVPLLATAAGAAPLASAEDGTRLLERLDRLLEPAQPRPWSSYEAADLAALIGSRR